MSIYRLVFEKQDIEWLDKIIIDEWEEAGKMSTFSRIAKEEEIEARCQRFERIELLNQLKKDTH